MDADRKIISQTKQDRFAEIFRTFYAIITHEKAM